MDWEKKAGYFGTPHNYARLNGLHRRREKCALVGILAYWPESVTESDNVCCWLILLEASVLPMIGCVEHILGHIRSMRQSQSQDISIHYWSRPDLLFKKRGKHRTRHVDSTCTYSS